MTIKNFNLKDAPGLKLGRIRYLPSKMAMDISHSHIRTDGRTRHFKGMRSRI